jgi:hypothetical protein
VIQGNFVDFFETSEDIIWVEAMTKVVGAPEDDDPVIFFSCFLTLWMVRLSLRHAIAIEMGEIIRSPAIQGLKRESATT